MNAVICPYCRGPIEGGEQSLECAGCGTPHHADCYAENGGCTVFGCSAAPPEEPKVSVSAPDLANVGAAAAAARAPSPAAVAPPPPPGGAAPEVPTSLPELERIAYSVVPSMFAPYLGSVATPTQVESESTQEPAGPPKTRMGYMVLGALLGALGAHNWYAGYYKKAAAQLAITVVTLGFGSPMSWIWAIIDICTVDRDAKGVQFTY